MKRLYGGATLVPSLVFKNVKATDPCAFDVSVPILQTKDPRLRRSRVRVVRRQTGPRPDPGSHWSAART